MKRYLLPMALVSMMAWQCSDPLSKQIQGEWNLKKAEVVGLDSVCNAKSAQLTREVATTLASVKAELDSVKIDTRKHELIDRMNELNERIAAYSPENVKKMYLDEINSLGMNLSFYSTGKVVVQVTGDDEVVSNGTWRISGDTISTMFDNQPADMLIVRDVSGSSLRLYSPSMSDSGVNLLLDFKKL